MGTIHTHVRVLILVCLICCATARAQAPDLTYNEALVAVAEALGAAPGSLDPSQDLVADWYLDRAEAYQLLASLCDRYERPLPSDLEMTVLDEIVRYLVDTPPATRRTRSPFASEAGDGARLVKVYYATDRARTGSGTPSRYYDGNRSPNGRLEYGIAEVSIPANHRSGRIESPFLGIGLLRSQRRHVVVTTVTPLAYESFWAGIRGDSELLDQDAMDIIIFIHGYRTSFEGAARRTAQIVADMGHDEIGFEFVPVFYSWPSDASLLGYMSDREDVLWSASHIETFLLDTFERNAGARIHVVAHSMGSQGLLTALRLLSRSRGLEFSPLFESVLLAAPDFDAQVFQQQLANDAFLRLSRRWTVYMSDQDAALKASLEVNSAPRLGLPILAIDGVDMIDASGLEVSPWNVPEFHSYFATKSRVIEDIASALRGVAPASRGLLRQTLENLPYWRLRAADEG